MPMSSSSRSAERDPGRAASRPFADPGSGLRKGQEGLSYVEVLVATALLSVALIGIAALFSRSMADNVSAWRASMANNHGRTHVEEVSSLPIDRLLFEVPSGETEGKHRESWTGTNWETQEGDGEEAPWERTTKVRQFSISDLLPGDDTPDLLDKPLEGGTPDSFVHLRVARVEVRGKNPGVFGPDSRIDLLLLRGF